ncbi:MAG TPA: TlyA family RNA methyltransferase [Spirochaetota bacterium]|nr:TlyA family RNA methyltransferase [Spirochaetota bacterium]
MSDKERLDKHMADSGVSDSREKAKREILSGWVKVNGETVRDPSRIVPVSSDITVERPGGLYVSRGGEKLARAISFFEIDVHGMMCVDLGASTGGFTDCLLKNGASKVYSIDVGYGQLDYSLRNDSRVVVMERMNARMLTPEMFSDHISFVSADMSFISFTKVYPTVAKLFHDAYGIALIKPQFEADKSEHKKGVVVRAENHVAILTRTLETLLGQGISMKGLTHSPIKGPKGNIEFLLYFSSDGSPSVDYDIPSIVKNAHEILSSAE